MTKIEKTINCDACGEPIRVKMYLNSGQTSTTVNCECGTTTTINVTALSSPNFPMGKGKEKESKTHYP